MEFASYKFTYVYVCIYMLNNLRKDCLFQLSFSIYYTPLSGHKKEKTAYTYIHACVCIYIHANGKVWLPYYNIMLFYVVSLNWNTIYIYVSKYIYAYVCKYFCNIDTYICIYIFIDFFSTRDQWRQYIRLREESFLRLPKCFIWGDCQ